MKKKLVNLQKKGCTIYYCNKLKQLFDAFVDYDN